MNRAALLIIASLTGLGAAYTIYLSVTGDAGLTAPELQITNAGTGRAGHRGSARDRRHRSHMAAAYSAEP